MSIEEKRAQKAFPEFAERMAVAAERQAAAAERQAAALDRIVMAVEFIADTEAP